MVFTSHPSNAERGGVFTFALDTNDIKARLIEKAVRFRNNWLGLPYGDQGLIINKHFYNCLGGYRKWPIMEDVDFCLLYTSPSPRDSFRSRMPSSA